MTNDEAIYVLKNTAWLGWDEQAQKVSEAVQMAVEALKRETSGDAIDRQAAIRIASGYCHPANIAKELAKLPPVQPEPQWIPVTERLPEGDTVVLCSIPASDGYIERIAFGYYMRFGNLGWRMSDWLQNHGEYGAMQPEPIAWMPLPEPYQEEGE